MENENKMKRFFDWVNADENLPSLEGLEHGHGGFGDDSHGDHDSHGGDDNHGGHDSHDSHSHDSHHAAEESSEADGGVQALESEDDELKYPDEVLPDEVSEEDSADAGEPGHAVPAETAAILISKKQKAQLHSFGQFYSIACVLLVLAVTVALLATVASLPKYGGPENPTVNEVYARYVEKGMEETGAVNTVAGMILDYRAFDTLGEAFVLFTATAAVIMLIRVPKDSPGPGEAGKEGEE